MLVYARAPPPAVVDAGKKEGAVRIHLADLLDEGPVVGLEAQFVKILALDVVNAHGEQHQVRLNAAKVLLQKGALQPGMGGSAVYPHLTEGKTGRRAVQIKAAEGITTFSLERKLQPVRIIGKVKVAHPGAVYSVHGVFPVQDEHRLQRAFTQHIHLVEGIMVLQDFVLPEHQVYDDPGRCIPRRHRHPREPQVRPLGFQAIGAVPGALPGTEVA